MYTTMLPVYCAWCGKFLYLTECCPNQAGKASHGMCQLCYEKALAEINDFAVFPASPEKQTKKVK